MKELREVEISLSAVWEVIVGIAKKVWEVMLAIFMIVLLYLWGLLVGVLGSLGSGGRTGSE